MELKTFKEFSEDVRARANIIDIIGSYIQLKKSGVNYKGLCPFHKEKTPSFIVQERKQFYHCFGCHAGGDVVKFIMQMENMDFKTAIELLAKRLGIPVPKFKSASKSIDEDAYRESLYELMKTAAEFYSKNLESPAGKTAKDYLINRGFDAETIKKFGIGYALSGWDGFLNHAKIRGFSEKPLIDTGMILQNQNDKNYHDKFRDRVMFPIYDTMGRVVAFGGRIISTGEPKYLNSPETIIFKKGQLLYNLDKAKNSLRDNHRFLLTEGYVDAITVSQYGFPNVVASLGTSLTENQAQLIKRYVPEVVFIYDGDEAGQKSMIRGIEILLRFDLKIKVVVLPENDDPDSFLRNNGKDALQALIDKSSDFFDFIMAAARKKYNINNVEGKVDAITLFTPLLNSVQNPLFLDSYYNRLAENLGIERGLLDKYVRTIASSLSSGKEQDISKSIDLKELKNIPFREKLLLKILIEYSPIRYVFGDLINANLDYVSQSFCKKWINLLLQNKELELNEADLKDNSENEDEAAMLREIILWKNCTQDQYNPESEIKKQILMLEYEYLQKIKKNLSKDNLKALENSGNIHKSSEKVIEIIKKVR